VGRYSRVLECQSPKPAERWRSLAAATFSRRAGRQGERGQDAAQAAVGE
jgi:hypothetical protein